LIGRGDNGVQHLRDRRRGEGSQRQDRCDGQCERERMFTSPRGPHALLPIQGGRLPAHVLDTRCDPDDSLVERLTLLPCQEGVVPFSGDRRGATHAWRDTGRQPSPVPASRLDTWKGAGYYYSRARSEAPRAEAAHPVRPAETPAHMFDSTTPAGVSVVVRTYVRSTGRVGRRLSRSGGCLQGQAPIETKPALLWRGSSTPISHRGGHPTPMAQPTRPILQS
jgi:hypothetical protein